MILEQIAASTRLRVEKQKKLASFQEIKAKAQSLPKGNFLFEKALKGPGISMICEVKKASPSKGIISEDFPYLSVAREYDKAGASAISVLTEPEHFLGSDRYLQEIKAQVSIPVLRKDFTIDPYQIYEAKLLGADAVLLICSLLNQETLTEYLSICDDLGLSALTEAHTPEEISCAIQAGARIIGVNNRNLNTFQVDISNAVQLRQLVPDHVIFVAESGVKTARDMRSLKDAGVDAVLIGETLMRSDNIAATVKELLA